MTYDIKLDLIFNTIDPVVLRRSVADNYLVRKGVTALLDKITRSSIVIFDELNKEWMDGNSVIDTTERTTLFPFSLARTTHQFALNCGCTDEYASRFYEKIDRVVDAYTLTMIPILRQRQIDQLEADLIPLEQQQAIALDAVRDASVVVVDTQLEGLRIAVSDKNTEIEGLNQTILLLTAFQSELVQSLNKDASNLWGLLNKVNEDARLNLVGIVKQQNVYANELKSADDLRLTLVVSNARLLNLNADKDQLDQDIATIEQQNSQAQQARELSALRGLSALTRQITDIKNQLILLNQ